MWNFDLPIRKERTELVISKAPRATNRAGGGSGGGSGGDDGGRDYGGDDELDSAEVVTRRRALRKLASALSTSRTAGADAAGAAGAAGAGEAAERKRKARGIAAEVEAELFERFGGANKQYRAQVRSLHASLKLPGNHVLRDQVLAETVSAEELSLRTGSQLLSGVLGTAKEQVFLAGVREITAQVNWTTANAGTYTCGQCKATVGIRYCIVGGLSQGTSHKAETWGNKVRRAIRRGERREGRETK